MYIDFNELLIYENIKIQTGNKVPFPYYWSCLSDRTDKYFNVSRPYSLFVFSENEQRLQNQVRNLLLRVKNAEIIRAKHEDEIFELKNINEKNNKVIEKALEERNEAFENFEKLQFDVGVERLINFSLDFNNKSRINSNPYPLSQRNTQSLSPNARERGSIQELLEIGRPRDSTYKWSPSQGARGKKKKSFKMKKQKKKKSLKKKKQIKKKKQKKKKKKYSNKKHKRSTIRLKDISIKKKKRNTTSI